MSELEDRLHDLTSPTDPGAAGPSLHHVELEAAARRSRHRSARILAAAAIVVVVTALAVVVVRRPQPSNVATLGSTSPTMGSVFGPPESWQTCIGPPNDEPSDTTDTNDTTGWYCPDLPSYLSFVWFDPVPGTDPAQVDAAMALLRERLTALGVGDADVAPVEGHVKVTFPRAFPAGFADHGVEILIQDLPLTLNQMDYGADTDTPDRAQVIPPPSTTP